MTTSQTFTAGRRTRRMRSALLAPTLAGLVAAAAVSGPAGAVAGTTTSSLTLTDPAGDVWAIGEGENEEWTQVSDLPTADVVGATVRHRRGSVVVRMDFADLRREDPAQYTAMVITPERLRAAFVSTGPGQWGGRHMLVNGNYGKVRCPGFEHSVDYATDRVSMTLPRRCLGSPRWVRVSMSNFTFRGDAEGSFQEITDNPHTADAEGGTTGRLYRAR